MWIEHRRMINVFALASEGGFDNERLNIDIRLLERGELRRHHADFCGLQSAFIDETGDFNTTTLRQVIDESVIGDVTIYHARRTSFHRMDDERTILLTALISLLIEFTAFQRGFLCFPFCKLVFATSEIFIEWNLILLDEVGTVVLDEPWNILAEMLARFGDEISHTAEDFI